MLSGCIAGCHIVCYQLKNAQAYVETLAVELHQYQYRETHGSFPKNLTGLPSYNSTDYLPLGFLRKRRIKYSLRPEDKEFTIWFHYRAFLIASYDSAKRIWSFDD